MSSEAMGFVHWDASMVSNSFTYVGTFYPELASNYVEWVHPSYNKFTNSLMLGARAEKSTT